MKRKLRTRSTVKNPSKPSTSLQLPLRLADQDIQNIIVADSIADIDYSLPFKVPKIANEELQNDSLENNDVTIKNVSEIEVLDATAEWAIKNYSFLALSKGECITSPIYRPVKSQNTTFCLKLYPAGQENQQDPGVSLYLNIQSNFPKVKAQYQFGIINKNGEKKYCNGASVQTFQNNVWDGLWNFLNKDIYAEEDLLPNDTLTILCKIRIGSNIHHVVDFQHFDNLNSDKMRLQEFDYFENLLEDCKFADVELLVGDKKIAAHKSILCARSPIFLNFLNNVATKDAGNKISYMYIDMDEEAFIETLRFIYTGRVNKLHQLAEKLLIASDKYKLQGLKKLCEHELYSQLTIENACNILLQAETSNAAFLKNNVISFIKIYREAIAETEGYKNVLKSNTDLIVKTFQPLKTGFRNVANEAIENVEKCKRIGKVNYLVNLQ